VQNRSPSFAHGSFGEFPAAISGFTAPPRLGFGVENAAAGPERSRTRDCASRLTLPASSVVFSLTFSRPSSPFQKSTRPSYNGTDVTAVGLQTSSVAYGPALGTSVQSGTASPPSSNGPSQAPAAAGSEEAPPAAPASAAVSMATTARARTPTIRAETATAISRYP
jgi:hypothetical protein